MSTTAKVALGLAIGGLVGYLALSLLRKYRNPCGTCLKLEGANLAAPIAVGTGAFLGALIALAIPNPV